MIVGAVTGPLYDAGYFYHLISTGSFLVVFGLMMTSLCTEYWQVMLAQAVCIGLGCGCIFVPSVAILPQYFTTRKAFAMGLAASGSSLGELRKCASTWQEHVPAFPCCITVADLVRWYHLPHCLLQAPTPYRLCMGHPRYSIHGLGNSLLLSQSYAHKGPSEAEARIPGISSFQGTSLRVLHRRLFLCLHRPLYTHLLYPKLCHHEAYHQYEPWILHASNP